VTWTCTSGPCPWGSSTRNHALIWPSSLGASSSRLGYTVSAAIYAPAATVNGLTIWLDSGQASLYAGLPTATSHRYLRTLRAGDSYPVSNLAAGEVLSVQDANAFVATLTVTGAPPPTTTTTTTSTTTTTTQPTTTTGPTTTTTIGPPSTTIPASSHNSAFVTWTCTSSPCPWGFSVRNHALVWPPSVGATSSRLGYTVSAPVYAPALSVNGLTIWLGSGQASLYAGLPGADSHRFLRLLRAGDSYPVSNLGPGEVLSVQDANPFSATLTTTGAPPPTTTTAPPACQDPTSCNPVSSIRSVWKCNTPGCTAEDWIGGVIAWPSWAAYENNARQGVQSRTVYSNQGEKLYPYMGAWASGCRITAVSGEVLIIEWRRGTDTWRSRYLQPGETHTIQLVGQEDGALLETPDTPTDFTVRIDNCTPQPVNKTASP
jgi:hypothetical protein